MCKQKYRHFDTHEKDVATCLIPMHQVAHDGVDHLDPTFILDHCANPKQVRGMQKMFREWVLTHCGVEIKTLDPSDLKHYSKEIFAWLQRSLNLKLNGSHRGAKEDTGIAGFTRCSTSSLSI
jgi:hypothetical protein